MDNLTEQILTPPEAAKFLRVTAETMRSWRKKGEGPKHVQILGTVRYAQSALVEWVKGQDDGITGKV